MKKLVSSLAYFLFIVVISMTKIFVITNLLNDYKEEVKFKKIFYKGESTLVEGQILDLISSNNFTLHQVFKIKTNETPETKAWSEPPTKKIAKSEPEAEPSKLEGKDLYISYLNEICSKYYPNVDPYIGLAVMDTETGGTYNPNLESKCGAVGLMQVIPKYHARRAEKYGLYDIWDPYTNIIAGVDLLSELYESEENWEDALYGYNHSKKYVRYVIAKAEEFRKDGILG